MPNPQLIYAANDTRTGYFAGGQYIRPYAGQGSVTALDFASFPPKVCHLENVPLSVIGPPTCLDGMANGRRILVAGAMTVDPKDATKIAYDNKLTLLRWENNTLRQLDQIETGKQPSGVCMSNDGTRAYVTLRAEGAIALFDLSGDKIKLVRRWQFIKPGQTMDHFQVSPCGTMGIAALQSLSQILIISIDKKGALKLSARLDAPKSVYSVAFHPTQKFALINCPFACCVTKVAPDKKGKWKVGKSWPVGFVPEGIEISRDGRWAAAACFEGSNPTSPNFEYYGTPAQVYVFEIDKRGELTQNTVFPLKGIPQGAVFTQNGKYIVAGQYGHGNLVVYKLQKGKWVDTHLRIDIPGQSACMRTALPEKWDAATPWIR